MIQHPECPKSGFHITVYGATHWRAMLTTDELAERLRQRMIWRGSNSGSHNFASIGSDLQAGVP
jgi:hypothetical protein